MEKLKIELSFYMKKKQDVLGAYGGAINMLTVYEENNLHYYSEADATKWVINDQSNVNLASECSNMEEQMKNSFVDLYHWIKGELYDLESFKSSLDCHKEAVSAHLDLAKKLQ